MRYCILYLVQSFHFIFLDISQNSDVCNILADFCRVHSPVFGVDCLRDGDATAEPRPGSYLQYPDKLFRPPSQTIHNLMYRTNHHCAWYTALTAVDAL